MSSATDSKDPKSKKKKARRLGNYRLIKKMSTDSRGNLYLAIHKLMEDTSFVVREISLESIDQNAYLHTMISREIKLLQEIKNPNIVNLVETFPTKNHLYLIYEFCNGGTLEKYIKKKEGKIEEKKVMRIIGQVLTGLCALWTKQIMHRDLKPGNILLHYNTKNQVIKDTPTFKLWNFGFSRRLKDEGEKADSGQRMTIVGTPAFMAPEIIFEQPYSMQADIWSVGVIMFQLLTGSLPFRGHDFSVIKRKFEKGQFAEIPNNLCLSRDCIDFVSGCLQVDPRYRFRTTELLGHSFLEGKYGFLGDRKRSGRLTRGESIEAIMEECEGEEEGIGETMFDQIFEGDGGMLRRGSKDVNKSKRSLDDMILESEVRKSNLQTKLLDSNIETQNIYTDTVVSTAVTQQKTLDIMEDFTKELEGRGTILTQNPFQLEEGVQDKQNIDSDLTTMGSNNMISKITEEEKCNPEIIEQPIIKIDEIKEISREERESLPDDIRKSIKREVDKDLAPIEEKSTLENNEGARIIAEDMNVEESNYVNESKKEIMNPPHPLERKDRATDGQFANLDLDLELEDIDDEDLEELNELTLESAFETYKPKKSIYSKEHWTEELHSRRATTNATLTTIKTTTTSDSDPIIEGRLEGKGKRSESTNENASNMVDLVDLNFEAAGRERSKRAYVKHPGSPHQPLTRASDPTSLYNNLFGSKVPDVIPNLFGELKDKEETKVQDKGQTAEMGYISIPGNIDLSKHKMNEYFEGSGTFNIVKERSQGGGNREKKVDYVVQNGEVQGKGWGYRKTKTIKRK